MLILYIEDDSVDQAMFSRVASMVNPSITLVHANSGDEALKILKEIPILPSYIFLDVNMPGMDGKTCLTNIKQYKELEVVPIIMYSTSDESNDKEMFIGMGASDYIVKSSSFSETVDSLRNIFACEAAY